MSNSIAVQPERAVDCAAKALGISRASIDRHFANLFDGGTNVEQTTKGTASAGP